MAARYDTESGTRLSIWDWKSFNSDIPSITTEELVGTSTQYQITWSPTRRYIAVNSSVWIYIIDTTTGSTLAQLYDRERTGTAGALDVAWAPDEQSVYVLYEIRDVNQLLQWDVNTSQVAQTILSRENFFPPISMRQNPDGQQLAISVGYGSVVILRAPDFDVEQELFVAQSDSSIPYVSHLIWSQDNTDLYGIASDGTAYLWNTATGTTVATDSLVPNQDFFLGDVATSPYGGRLAMALRWSPGTAASTESNELQTMYQPFLEGRSVIVVPFPSFDRLSAIIEQCSEDIVGPLPEALSTLSSNQPTEKTLPDPVQALSTDAIPSACRADLIAIAESLESSS